MKGGENNLGIFSYFLDSIRGVDPTGEDWWVNLDFGDETAARIYLKNLAKNTVLDFVSRTMSTAKIRSDSKDWEYILNVRPNSDQSATDFWQQFFYTLMDDNEVLVILTDDDQLLIAEDFTRNEYAVYEDTFTGVTVKKYVFQRSFKMHDVIYLQYNNDNLEKFTKGLFDDYAELYGRIMEVAMRNNQIRGAVSIDQSASYKDKDKNGKSQTERLQNFIDKIFNSFSHKSVAIVPKLNGIDYEEFTNKQGVSNQSLEELNKMIRSLIDMVANAVGVPTSLLYGDKAELDQNLKAFRKLCVIPLLTKLEDQLNAKVLSKQEYSKGGRIKVYNVLPMGPLENAVQADKLIASGTFFADEIRALFNYEPLPDGQGQVLRVTKNYTAVEGGEKENEETN